MEHTVRVTEVIPRGEFSFSVRFGRPPGFSFLPGQYMFITIGKGPLTLTRHLTISSGPADPYLEVTKARTGHPFAVALQGLKPGEEVTIRGPFGEFIFIGEHEKVAFIAGGIGITPLWSMIRNANEKMYPTDITLLYSAKTEKNVLFRNEMRELTTTNLHLSIVLTLTAPDPGWTGRTGRIDRQMIEQEIPDWRDRIFYTSGPLAMVNAIIALLHEIGVPDDQIRYEYFPGY